MKKTALLSLLFYGLAASAASLGCGSAPEQESVSSGDDALRAHAHAPIPEVLQYVGAYEGGGTVSALELRRDGTFTATIDGARCSGRYEGPHAPTTAVKIAFIAHGEAFSATVPEWSEKQRLVVTRAGHVETVTSAWKAGSEQICDDSGGAWTDDDPDPATGLYCVCASPLQYIPSLGGCTR